MPVTPAATAKSPLAIAQKSNKIKQQHNTIQVTIIQFTKPKPQGVANRPPRGTSFASAPDNSLWYHNIEIIK